MAGQTDPNNPQGQQPTTDRGGRYEDPRPGLQVDPQQQPGMTQPGFGPRGLRSVMSGTPNAPGGAFGARPTPQTQPAPAGGAPQQGASVALGAGPGLRGLFTTIFANRR